MLERYDRIKEETITTGTGTVSLNGTSPTGYRNFVDEVTDGATVRYLIENDDSSEWEVGEGVFTDASPDTISRDTVFASSNAGSLVDFSAGTKNVTLVFTAEDIDDFNDGWIDVKDTWTYSSVDDPTGVITVPSGATSKYSVGMRISFVNGGNTIYGIITAVTSTSITFLHEIDPTDSQALYLMANSAITSPKYSTQKAPFAFPMEKTKWTVEVEDNTLRTETTPTQNSWYNTGSISIDIPIGAWDIMFRCDIQATRDTNRLDIEVALSDSASSVSNNNFYATARGYDTYIESFTIVDGLELSVKDTYYAIMRTTTASVDAILFRNDRAPMRIRAVCAYL